MRTSGTASEAWMTSIPLAILVFFLIYVYGGLRPALRALEGSLMAFVDWVSRLI